MGELDYELLENGANLSIGERKLIYLARVQCAVLHVDCWKGLLVGDYNACPYNKTTSS